MKELGIHLKFKNETEVEAQLLFWDENKWSKRLSQTEWLELRKKFPEMKPYTMISVDDREGGVWSKYCNNAGCGDQHSGKNPWKQLERNTP